MKSHVYSDTPVIVLLGVDLIFPSLEKVSARRVVSVGGGQRGERDSGRSRGRALVHGKKKYCAI